MNTTPRYRLETLFNDKLNNVPGNEVPVRKAQMEAEIQCAIEITDTLHALTVAVNDMANRSVTATNNLITEIDKATAQAAESSKESGKLAAESANLSRKLNRLTIWIIIAAFLSAIAAVVQASAAIFTALRPGR